MSGPHSLREYCLQMIESVPIEQLARQLYDLAALVEIELLIDEAAPITTRSTTPREIAKSIAEAIVIAATSHEAN